MRVGRGRCQHYLIGGRRRTFTTFTMMFRRFSFLGAWALFVISVSITITIKLLVCQGRIRISDLIVRDERGER
jgi:hypothetical protein